MRHRPGLQRQTFGIGAAELLGVAAQHLRCGIAALGRGGGVSAVGEGQPEQGWVGESEADVSAARGGKAGAAAAGRFRGKPLRLTQQRHPGFGQCREQRLLVGEVAIDRGGRNSDRAGEFAQRDMLGIRSREQRQSGFDQCRAQVAVVVGARFDFGC